MDPSMNDAKNLTKISKMVHALEESNRQLFAKVSSKCKTIQGVQPSIRQALNTTEGQLRQKPSNNQFSPERQRHMDQVGEIYKNPEFKDYSAYERPNLLIKLQEENKGLVIENQQLRDKLQTCQMQISHMEQVLIEQDARVKNDYASFQNLINKFKMQYESKKKKCKELIKLLSDKEREITKIKETLATEEIGKQKLESAVTRQKKLSISKQSPMRSEGDSQEEKNAMQYALFLEEKNRLLEERLNQLLERREEPLLFSKPGEESRAISEVRSPNTEFSKGKILLMLSNVRDYCCSLEKKELATQEQLNKYENKGKSEYVTERKLLLEKLSNIRKDIEEIAMNSVFFNQNKTLNLKTDEEVIDIQKYKALKKKLKSQHKEKEKLIEKIMQLEAEMLKTTQEREQLQQKCEDFSQEITFLSEKVKTISERLDRAHNQHKKDIDSKNQQITQLNQQLALLNNDSNIFTPSNNGERNNYYLARIAQTIGLQENSFDTSNNSYILERITSVLQRYPPSNKQRTNEILIEDEVDVNEPPLRSRMEAPLRAEPNLKTRNEREELVETVQEMANYIRELELNKEALNTEIAGLLSTIQELRSDEHQNIVGSSNNFLFEQQTLYTERLKELERGLEERDRERQVLRRRTDDLEKENSLMKYELGKVDKDAVKELRAERDKLILESQDMRRRLDKDQEFLLKLKEDLEKREKSSNKAEEEIIVKNQELSQLKDKLTELKESYARDLKERQLEMDNCYDKIDEMREKTKVLNNERDVLIRVKDEISRNRDEALSDRDEALRDKDEVLRERDEALRERDEALRERDEILKERDFFLEEREDFNNAQQNLNSEKERAIKLLGEAQTQLDKLARENSNLRRMNEATGQDYIDLRKKCCALEEREKSYQQREREQEERVEMLLREYSELENMINSRRGLEEQNIEQMQNLEDELAQRTVELEQEKRVSNNYREELLKLEEEKNSLIVKLEADINRKVEAEIQLIEMSRKIKREKEILIEENQLIKQDNQRLRRENEMTMEEAKAAVTRQAQTVKIMEETHSQELDCMQAEILENRKMMAELQQKLTKMAEDLNETSNSKAELLKRIEEQRKSYENLMEELKKRDTFHKEEKGRVVLELENAQNEVTFTKQREEKLLMKKKTYKEEIQSRKRDEEERLLFYKSREESWQKEIYELDRSFKEVQTLRDEESRRASQEKARLLEEIAELKETLIEMSSFREKMMENLEKEKDFIRNERKNIEERKRELDKEASKLKLEYNQLNENKISFMAEQEEMRRVLNEIHQQSLEMDAERENLMQERLNIDKNVEELENIRGQLELDREEFEKEKGELSLEKNRIIQKKQRNEEKKQAIKNEREVNGREKSELKEQLESLEEKFRESDDMNAKLLLSFESEREQFNSQIKSLTKELEELENKCLSLEQQTSQYARVLEIKEKEELQLKELLQDLNEQLEEEKASKEERLQNMIEENHRMVRRLEILENENNVLKAQLDENHREYDENTLSLRRQISELAAESNERASLLELEKENIKQEAEFLKRLLEEKEKGESDTEAELQRLEVESIALNRKILTLENDLLDKEKSLGKKESSLKNLNERMKESENAVQVLQEKLAESEAHYQVLNLKEKALSAEISALRESLKNVNKELVEFQVLSENLHQELNQVLEEREALKRNINTLGMSNLEVNELLENTRSQNAATEKKILELINEYQILSSANENLKEMLEEKELELNNLAARYTEINNDYENSINELNICQRTLQSMLESLERKNQDCETYSEEIQRLNDEKSVLEENLVSEKTSTKELKSDLEHMALRKAETESDLAKARNLNSLNSQEIDTLNKELLYLREQKEISLRLTAELEQLKTQYETIDNEYNSLQIEFSNINEEALNYKKLYTALKDENVLLKNECEEVKERRNSLQLQNDKMINELRETILTKDTILTQTEQNLQVMLNLVQKKADSLQEMLESNESEHQKSAAASKADIENLQSTIAKMKAKSEETASELTEATKKLSQLSKQLKAVETEREEENEKKDEMMRRLEHSMESGIQEWKTEKENLTMEIAMKDEEIARLEAELASNQLERQATEEELSKHRSKVEKLKNKKIELNETLNSHSLEANAQLESTNRKVSQLEQEVVNLSESLKESRGKIEEWEKHNREKESEIKELNSNLSNSLLKIAEDKTLIDNIVKLKEDLEAMVIAQEEKISELAVQLHSVEVTNAELRDSNEELNKEIEIWKCEASEKQEKIEALNKALSSFESKIEETMTSLEQTEGKLRDTEGKLNDTGEKLNEAGEKLNEAEEKLNEAGEKLIETEGRLIETEGRLSDTEGKLIEVGGKLIETEGKLVETEEKLVETEGRLGETEGKLGETQGKLIESEKKLRETAFNLNLTRVDFEEAQKSLKDKDEQNLELERMINNVDRLLTESKKKQEQELLDTALIHQKEVKAVRENLDSLSKKWEESTQLVENYSVRLKEEQQLNISLAEQLESWKMQYKVAKNDLDVIKTEFESLIKDLQLAGNEKQGELAKLISENSSLKLKLGNTENDLESLKQHQERDQKRFAEKSAEKEHEYLLLNEQKSILEAKLNELSENYLSLASISEGQAEQINDLSKIINDLREQVVSLEQKSSDQELLLEKSALTNKDLDSKIMELDELIKRLSLDKEMLEGQIQRERELNASHESDIEELNKNILDLKSMLDDRNEHNLIINKELTEKNSLLEALYEKSRKDEDHINSLKKNVSELETTLIALTQDSSSIGEKLLEKQGTIENMEIEVSDLKLRITEITSQKNTCLEENKALALEIEGLRNSLSNSMKEIEALKLLIENEKESHTTTIQENKEALAHLIESLRESESEYNKREEEHLNTVKTMEENVAILEENIANLEEVKLNSGKQIELLTTELASIKDELDSAREENSVQVQEILSYVEKLTNITNERDSLSKKLEEVEKECSIKNSKVEELICEKELANKEIQSKTEEILLQEIKITELKSESAQKSNSIESLEQLLQSKAEEIDDLSMNLKIREGSITLLNEQIEGLTKEISKMGESEITIKGELISISKEYKETSEQLNKIKLDKDELEKENNQAIQNLNLKINQTEEKLLQAHGEIDSLRLKLNNLQVNFDALSNDKQNLDEEFASLSKEKNILKEQLDDWLKKASFESAAAAELANHIQDQDQRHQKELIELKAENKRIVKTLEEDLLHKINDIKEKSLKIEGLEKHAINKEGLANKLDSELTAAQEKISNIEQELEKLKEESSLMLKKKELEVNEAKAQGASIILIQKNAYDEKEENSRKEYQALEKKAKSLEENLNQLNSELQEERKRLENSELEVGQIKTELEEEKEKLKKNLLELSEVQVESLEKIEKIEHLEALIKSDADKYTLSINEAASKIEQLTSELDSRELALSQVTEMLEQLKLAGVQLSETHFQKEEEMNQKYEDLNKNVYELRAAYEVAEKRIEKKKQSKLATKQQLALKTEELSVAKQEIEDVNTNVQASTEKHLELSTQLSETRQSLEEALNNLRGSALRNEELEQELKNSQQEIINLGVKIEQGKEEIEGLKAIINKESNVRVELETVVKTTEITIAELERKSAQQSEEGENLKGALKKEGERASLLEKEIKSQIEKLEENQRKFEALEINEIANIKLNEELQAKLTNLEEVNTKLTNTIAQKDEEVHSFQSKFTEASIELSEKEIRIKNLLGEVELLKALKNNLKDERENEMIKYREILLNLENQLKAEKEHTMEENEKKNSLLQENEMNILDLNTKLEEYRDQIETMELEHKRFEKFIQELKLSESQLKQNLALKDAEIGTVKQELERSREDFAVFCTKNEESLNMREAEHKSQKESLQSKISNLEKEVQSIKNEVETKEARCLSLLKKGEEMQELLDKNEFQLQQKDKSIEDLTLASQGNIGKLQHHLEELMAEVEDLRSKLAQSEKVLREKEENLGTRSETIRQHSERIEELEKKLSQSENKSEELKEAVSRLAKEKYEEVESIKKNLDETNEKHSQHLELVKESHTTEAGNLQEKLSKSNLQNEDLSRRLETAENKNSEMTIRINSLEEHKIKLSQEFAVSLEMERKKTESLIEEKGHLFEKIKELEIQEASHIQEISDLSNVSQKATEVHHDNERKLAEQEQQIQNLKTNLDLIEQEKRDLIGQVDQLKDNLTEVNKGLLNSQKENEIHLNKLLVEGKEKARLEKCLEDSSSKIIEMEQTFMQKLIKIREECNNEIEDIKTDHAVLIEKHSHESNEKLLGELNLLKAELDNEKNRFEEKIKADDLSIKELEGKLIFATQNLENKEIELLSKKAAFEELLVLKNSLDDDLLKEKEKAKEFIKKTHELELSESEKAKSYAADLEKKEIEIAGLKEDLLKLDMKCKEFEAKFDDFTVLKNKQVISLIDESKKEPGSQNKSLQEKLDISSSERALIKERIEAMKGSVSDDFNFILTKAANQNQAIRSELKYSQEFVPSLENEKRGSFSERERKSRTAESQKEEESLYEKNSPIEGFSSEKERGKNRRTLTKTVEDEASLIKVTLENDNKEKEIDDLRNTLKEKDLELIDLEAERNNLIEEAQKKDDEIKQLRKALNDERDRIERFSESPINNLNLEDFHKLDTRIKELEEELDDKEQEGKTNLQKLTIFQKEIEDLKEEKDELAKINRDLREFTAKNPSIQEILGKEREMMNREIEEYKEDIEEYGHKIKALEGKLSFFVDMTDEKIKLRDEFKHNILVLMDQIADKLKKGHIYERLKEIEASQRGIMKRLGNDLSELFLNDLKEFAKVLMPAVEDLTKGISETQSSQNEMISKIVELQQKVEEYRVQNDLLTKLTENIHDNKFTLYLPSEQFGAEDLKLYSIAKRIKHENLRWALLFQKVGENTNFIWRSETELIKHPFYLQMLKFFKDKDVRQKKKNNLDEMVKMNKELEDKIKNMQNKLIHAEEELAVSRRDNEALRRQNTDFDKEGAKQEEERKSFSASLAGVSAIQENEKDNRSFLDSQIDLKDIGGEPKDVILENTIQEKQRLQEENENLKKHLESFTSVNRTEQENKELNHLRDQIANYDKSMKERNADFEINENKMRMEIRKLRLENSELINQRDDLKKKLDDVNRNFEASQAFAFKQSLKSHLLKVSEYMLKNEKKNAETNMGIVCSLIEATYDEKGKLLKMATDLEVPKKGNTKRITRCKPKFLYPVKKK